MDIQALKNKYDIIGSDPALNEALETALTFASTDMSVLIQGESGVGKENFAKIIHQYSSRKSQQLFTVNCGAVSKDLMNSELFGHMKGSFTGAVDTRKGYFEVANGSTLFLDEIAELPLESQALLLRVLQSGEYRKVGSNTIEHTNVRVVAATNANLYELVKLGKFRKDLYFRLSAAQIRVPSLRERKDDIYLLFRKFTSDFSEANGMCKISLKPDAIRLLVSYRWPGNVRQLMGFTQSVTARFSHRVTATMTRIELDARALEPFMPREEGEPLPVLFDSNSRPRNEGGLLEEERQAIYKAILDLKNDVEALKAQVMRRELPPREERQEAEWQGPEEQDFDEGGIVSIAAHKDVDADLSIRHSEDELIRKALDKHHGNRKLAAKELGMSERTLYRKMPEDYKKK